MEEKVNNQQKSSRNKAIIIVLVLIILCLLGFVVYDKFIQKDTKPEANTQEKECNCQKCDECEKCENNTSQCNCSNESSLCLGEKVNSVKKIKLTNTNQTFKIGNKEVKLKIANDGEYTDVLFVNDEAARKNFGTDRVSIDEAYLTDKFILFTHYGQSNEVLSYAISEYGGEIITNFNGYQVHDIMVVNNYLHATGHVFCGEYESGDHCEDKDIIIKYFDGTLIMSEVE